MKRFCFWLTTLLLAGTCAVGGGFRVHATEKEKAVAKGSKAAEIRFCSYNLKNYLKMERFVEGVRTEGIGKPQREIEAVVKFLTEIDADVLGVSEIGSSDDLADLQSRLKEEGIEYLYLEHAHGGDPVRSLGLLSKLPIVARQSRNDLVYQLGEQTLPMQRGILDVTIQAGAGKKLRCLGVHLKSKREVGDADEALMRRNEALLLRQHANAILKEAPETLLLTYGDFNEHAHEASIREVENGSASELNLRDVKVVDTRGQTWTHYWEEADVYSRFDYVFVNPALSKLVNRKASYIYDVPEFPTGSDHRPIVVALRLRRD